MKVRLSLLLLLWVSFFAGYDHAQIPDRTQKLQNDEARSSTAPPAADVTPPAAKDLVPLPSIKSLTASQASGKKLFVQRCSICHLPAMPSYSTYGPVLSGELINSLGDAFVREQITRGTSRMPGYQYTLSSAEIDEIIGYLKTIEFTKKD